MSVQGQDRKTMQNLNRCLTVYQSAALCVFYS